MFCPKCGKESPDGTKFCADCGAIIEIVAASRPVAAIAGGVSDPMTFGGSISTCFSKFFEFNGRASRPEYWWFYLFTVLVTWGAILVDKTEILSSLVSLVLGIPALSAGSRRLHDTNRSGWWQLLFLTIIGIIPVVIWLASKGSKQDNEYGGAL